MCAPYPITNAELYPRIAKFPLRSHLHVGQLYCSRTQNEYFVHVLNTWPQIQAALLNNEGIHPKSQGGYTVHRLPNTQT